jgi:preprotein translocase subunit SecB
MAKDSTKTVGLEKPIDYEIGLRVSDIANIRRVRMISCSCFHTLSRVGDEHSVTIDCQVKTQADRKNHCILVFPRFKLEAFPSNKTKRNCDVVIEAEFVLVYAVDSLEGIKQKNLDVFGQTNGVFNAWPYWREFVQSITTRMGLPPLTLPAYRLAPPAPRKAVKADRIAAKK